LPREGAIDIASLDRDLDRAVVGDDNTRGRQVDLVRLRRREIGKREPILLLYSRDSAGPVARLEFSSTTEQPGHYASTRSI
jgi:hypothetical protein